MRLPGQPEGAKTKVMPATHGKLDLNTNTNREKDKNTPSTCECESPVESLANAWQLRFTVYITSPGGKHLTRSSDKEQKRGKIQLVASKSFAAYLRSWGRVSVFPQGFGVSPGILRVTPTLGCRAGPALSACISEVRAVGGVLGRHSKIHAPNPQTPERDKEQTASWEFTGLWPRPQTGQTPDGSPHRQTPLPQ